MKNIKKFEFPELAKKTEEEEIKVVEESESTEEVIEEVSQSFADENSLEEVGQQLEPLREVNLIKLTEEELEEKIANAKAEAVSDYIESQAHIVAEETKNSLLLEEILATTSEIRDSVRSELNNILEKFLELSYEIAAKVIDIQLMTIPKDNFITLLSNEMKNMKFHEGIRVEVKDEAVAEVLASNGVEVSVKNDMIGLDYKIVWCNGFLERKASDIISEIEGILIDQMKK
jgi:hypothetical protein